MSLNSLEMFLWEIIEKQFAAAHAAVDKENLNKENLIAYESQFGVLLASDIVCWQNKQKKDLVYKKKTTTRHI